MRKDGKIWIGCRSLKHGRKMLQWRAVFIFFYLCPLSHLFHSCFFILFRLNLFTCILVFSTVLGDIFLKWWLMYWFAHLTDQNRVLIKVILFNKFILLFFSVIVLIVFLSSSSSSSVLLQTRRTFLFCLVRKPLSGSRISRRCSSFTSLSSYFRPLHDPWAARLCSRLFINSLFILHHFAPLVLDVSVCFLFIVYQFVCLWVFSVLAILLTRKMLQKNRIVIIITIITIMFITRVVIIISACSALHSQHCVMVDFLTPPRQVQE